MSAFLSCITSSWAGLVIDRVQSWREDCLFIWYFIFMERTFTSRAETSHLCWIYLVPVRVKDHQCEGWATWRKSFVVVNSL